jgi:hypothetical protein
MPCLTDPAPAVAEVNASTWWPHVVQENKKAEEAVCSVLSNNDIALAYKMDVFLLFRKPNTESFWERRMTSEVTVRIPTRAEIILHGSHVLETFQRLDDSNHFEKFREAMTTHMQACDPNCWLRNTRTCVPETHKWLLLPRHLTNDEVNRKKCVVLVLKSLWVKHFFTETGSSDTNTSDGEDLM